MYYLKKLLELQYLIPAIMIMIAFIIGLIVLVAGRKKIFFKPPLNTSDEAFINSYDKVVDMRTPEEKQIMEDYKRSMEQ